MSASSWKTAPSKAKSLGSRRQNHRKEQRTSTRYQLVSKFAEDLTSEFILSVLIGSCPYQMHASYF